MQRKRNRSIAVSPRRKPVPSLRSASACETGLWYGRVGELREKTFFLARVWRPSPKGKKKLFLFLHRFPFGQFLLRCVARVRGTYPG